MNLLRTFLFISLISLLFTSSVSAEDQTFTIIFKDHHFDPQSLVLPPKKKIVLKVLNQSSEAIEFESFKLNREKPVPPNGTIDVYLPELNSGSYDFYDDFHKDVPEGEIIVK